ncbi:MAG: hypothetical protein DCC49_03550 [Acidobacteria bacterium]|nr:MAG: hypothetical protein DCC49_03550 [Acidobacteriota bacterium]
MLVRDTLDACECEVCGISCTGRFANCWRSIFQASGRVVQMRCLPPSLPQPSEAASASGLAEGTEPLITNSPTASAQGEPGSGAGASADLAEATTGERGADLSQDLMALQERVSEIVGLIQELSLENEALRNALASITARIEDVDSSLKSAGASMRPVTHVVRASGESGESFTRPGRAVAHPDVVHRQQYPNTGPSADDEFVTHPVAAEGSGGGIG